MPYSEYRYLFPYNANNCVEFCHALALDLKDKLKLKKLDQVIYSASRYLKLPFSLDKRNKRVILPLTDEEFLNWNDSYMSMNYVLNKSNLGFIDACADRYSNPSGFKRMVDSL